MKKLIIASFAALVLLGGFPSFVAAQSTLTNPASKSISNPEDPGFQLVPCDGVKDPNDPNSVACDFGQAKVLFNRILNFLLYLSIPLVLAMIMYTAYTYLTANGDQSKIFKAKQMLIPVALGIFWVLAGFIVVRTLLDSFLAEKIGSETKDTFINRFLGK